MKITAAQYAKEINVSRSLVSKRLQAKTSLPFTKSVEKFGNTWIIELTKNFDADKAAKEFKIYKNG